MHVNESLIDCGHHPGSFVMPKAKSHAKRPSKENLYHFGAAFMVR